MTLVTHDQHTSQTRHRDLDRLTCWLQSLWHARHIQDIEPSDSPAGLIVLPMFIWAHNNGASGRKSRARRADETQVGSDLLMPFRLTWDVPPVLIVEPGVSITANFTAVGPGHTSSGSVQLTSSPRTVHHLPDLMQGIQVAPGAQSIGVPSISATQIRRALEAINRQGMTSRWELIQWVEPQVKRLLEKAHSSMVISLAGELGTGERTWLDEQSLQKLTDQMLLGFESRQGSVPRWINLSMEPGSFAKCDPLRHLVVHLGRDARQEVRSCIGDPRAGSKIRQLARSLGTEDVDAIVAEYRRRYPKDEVAQGSVIQALNLAPDATAGALKIEDGLTW